MYEKRMDQNITKSTSLEVCIAKKKKKELALIKVAEFCNLNTSVLNRLLSHTWGSIEKR